MLSDKELIEMMREGDERALIALHERYAKSMFITAAKRLNSAEDAEEVVMDIFHSIWQMRETFELQQDSLRGYLSVAVANQVFKVIHRRHASIISRGNETALDTQFTPSSEEEFIIKELQEKIETAIRQLPEQCQLVFRMHHDDDLSRKEIAERLHISENTVKYHLKRANADIKNTLKTVGLAVLGMDDFLYIMHWTKQ